MFMMPTPSLPRESVLALEWFTPITNARRIFTDLSAATLNWNALAKDLASRADFLGCLEYRDAGVQFRRYYLNGIEVGTAHAARPGFLDHSFESPSSNDGRVGLFQLEPMAWLDLISSDAVACTNKPTVVYRTDGLIERLAGSNRNPISTTEAAMPAPAPKLETSPVDMSRPQAIPEALLQAWTAVLAGTQECYKRIPTVGQARFNLAWRGACLALADKYLLLDPFAAEIEWRGDRLHLRDGLEDHLVQTLEVALFDAYNLTVHDLGHVEALLRSLNIGELTLAFPEAHLDQLLARLEAQR
jgi:hypothetical protein